jgi:hypothetical protein
VKWIEDYVERQTAGARKRVDDADAAVPQEQDNIKHADIAGLANGEPEKCFVEVTVASRDSLGDLGCSDDGENLEDEDDQEAEQGKLSEED